MRQYHPPLVAWHISCGFPSPADDYCDSELDINELVIVHQLEALWGAGTGKGSRDSVGV